MRNLLRQRIDSEAAWMCHRIIVDEILRYQKYKIDPASVQEKKFQSPATSPTNEKPAPTRASDRLRWAARTVSKQQRTEKQRSNWSQVARSIIHAVKQRRASGGTTHGLLEQVRHEMRRTFVMSNEITGIGEFYRNLQSLDSLQDAPASN